MATPPSSPTESHLDTWVPFLVSAATPPLLAGLLLQQQCGQWIQDLGRWSESLFQGRRLPKLTFPEIHPPANDT